MIVFWLLLMLVPCCWLSSLHSHDSGGKINNTGHISVQCPDTTPIRMLLMNVIECQIAIQLLLWKLQDCSKGIGAGNISVSAHYYKPDLTAQARLTVKEALQKPQLEETPPVAEPILPRQPKTCPRARYSTGNQAISPWLSLKSWAIPE